VLPVIADDQDMTIYDGLDDIISLEDDRLHAYLTQLPT
jgi:hypothetical protein